MPLSLGGIWCFRIMSNNDSALLQMTMALGDCSLQNNTFSVCHECATKPGVWKYYVLRGLAKAYNERQEDIAAPTTICELGKPGQHQP